jgi:2-polyprenyl-3-methyl-5-hydroxy-6-metoxy-1,4-benzoquinol methylase
VIYYLVKLVNPNTIATAGTINDSIKTFLGYAFYVSFVLFFVAMGILIWDFFRKKPDEERTISKEVIVALDFSKMTTKQIAAFMDRLKDMSSAQIETLLGGQYAEAIKDITRHTKGKETKTSGATKKEGKKGGKA